MPWPGGFGWTRRVASARAAACSSASARVHLGKDVGVPDENIPRPERVRRPREAAGRAEELCLERQRGPREGLHEEAHLVRAVVRVDHDTRRPRGKDPLDHVSQGGPVAHGHESLGAQIRERPQAGPEAGCEDHHREHAGEHNGKVDDAARA